MNEGTSTSDGCRCGARRGEQGERGGAGKKNAPMGEADIAPPRPVAVDPRRRPLGPRPGRSPRGEGRAGGGDGRDGPGGGGAGRGLGTEGAGDDAPRAGVGCLRRSGGARRLRQLHGRGRRAGLAPATPLLAACRGQRAGESKVVSGCRSQVPRATCLRARGLARALTLPLGRQRQRDVRPEGRSRLPRWEKLREVRLRVRRQAALNACPPAGRREEGRSCKGGGHGRARTSCSLYFCRWLFTCWIVSPSIPRADDIRLTIPWVWRERNKQTISQLCMRLASAGNTRDTTRRWCERSCDVPAAEEQWQRLLPHLWRSLVEPA